MAGHDSSIKAILYAFLANLGIAIAKGIAWFFTGSGSMLAETIHSLADCANQALLYMGLKRSGRPPDENHPMGYGKVIYFWSFIVAMMLFSMGGLFSIYEGVHKLQNPEMLKSPWLALLVLGVSIVLESFSLMGALREIKKIRGQRSLGRWLKETRNAELVVVFGEDVAALLGLSIAFVFVLLSWLQAQPIYDALGSMAIGAMLIIISLFLVVRLKALLIGRSADPDIQKSIQEIMAADSNIVEVFNALTIQFGPEIMLAAKIRLKAGLTVEAGAIAVNELERKLKVNHPEIKWSFIEPDVED